MHLDLLSKDSPGFFLSKGLIPVARLGWYKKAQDSYLSALRVKFPLSLQTLQDAPQSIFPPRVMGFFRLPENSAHNIPVCDFVALTRVTQTVPKIPRN